MVVDKLAARQQNIIIENRRRMSVSGVIKVESFNESAIILETGVGRLTIEGEGLHISKLAVETGDMNVDGLVGGLYYTDEKSSERGRGGFISKIFK